LNPNLPPEERFHEDSASRSGDDRSPFQRDRDLILYSSAFKRLLSVTQVASASVGHVFHTRLTHSLQVAQVGRRLAEKLLKKQPELAAGQIDPDRVEAACLAHDIGHPPFGHLAEEILDKKAESFGGFEGNAQSFRIVTELSVTSSTPGLNLTRSTLKALLKYPWIYLKRPEDPTHWSGRKPKWGVYDCDRQTLKKIAGDDSGGPFDRTAEAELMDWADDVTYSVHDVEDFFRAGLIPLHLLKSYDVGFGKEPKDSRRTQTQPKERKRFFEYVVNNEKKDNVLKDLSAEQIAQIFDDLLAFGHFTLEQPYEGSREDHAGLRRFTSRLIGRFINALRLREPDKANSRTVERLSLPEQEIAILKQLTWFYVIDAPSLAIQKLAQAKIIERLFEVFHAEVHVKNPSGVLPIYYRELLKQPELKDENKSRAAVDLIASMTEAQAIAAYQRLEGITFDSGLDKILV
jgi:dGTPase